MSRLHKSPNLAVELLKQGKVEDAKKVAQVNKIILNLHEMVNIKEKTDVSKTC